MDSRERSRNHVSLKLTKTAFMVNSVKNQLDELEELKFSTRDNRGSYKRRSEVPMVRDRSRSSAEKVKASNFPAISITIGSWQWKTSRLGDLIAKIYYAKRKLVWEVLDGQLKKKMEIKWDHIAAIRATLDEEERGILEIELKQCPSFFREAPPQPRKHTNWQTSPDFTGGSAVSYRIHSLVFPPKILEKHYTQLLQYDEQLLLLSCRPFPSPQYINFDQTILQTSHDLSGRTVFLPGVQHPTYPPLAGDILEFPQNSVVSSVMHNQYPSQGQASCDRGEGDGNIHGPLSISSVTHCQNHQSSAESLYILPSDLLGASQVVFIEDEIVYAEAYSSHGQMDPNPDSSASSLAANHQSAYDGDGATILWNAIPQELVEWNQMQRIKGGSRTRNSGRFS